VKPLKKSSKSWLTFWSINMVEAASPWFWRPLVIWASPSLWLDEGKSRLLRLIPTIWCMYSCSHICTNHQGPLTHDIFGRCAFGK
jgi:hypothetical protein